VRRRTLDGWFINILPDLNQDDPETRHYLIQNSLWWVGRTGLDAIRQDTVPYVPRAFWSEWTAALRREFPRLNVIGEVFDGDPAMVAFFQGGIRRFDGVDSGLQSLFDFPLLFALRSAFAGSGQLRDVTKVLAHDYLYPNPNLLVTFLGLHDVSRFISEKGATLAGMKLAFATIFAVRGVPMIYYGDELALPGGNDPDNRRDFPGCFGGDPANGFTAPGRSREQEELVAWVTKLALLRHESDALRRGKTQNLFAGEQTWAFCRKSPAKIAVVIIHNDASAVTLDLDVSGTGLADSSTVSDRLGALGEVRVDNGKIHVAMPPRSAAVLE
jgi:neopullulanase